MTARALCFGSIGLYLGFKTTNYQSVRCESQLHESNISNWSYLKTKLDFPSLLHADVILSMTVATIPLFIVGITAYQTRRMYLKKHFSNIMNMSMNTIQRSGNNQYTLYWRTLIEKDINQIILNPTGVKALHKASKYTTSPQSPIIKPIDIHQHGTNCNQISNQLNALCAQFWIHRNLYNNNSNAIASDIYIYGIIGLQGQHHTKLALKKMYVILLKEKIIKEMIHEIGIKAVHNESDEEWKQRLKDYETARYYHKYRWMLIRHILKEYDKQRKTEDGSIQWGRPLCPIELSSFYDDKIAMTEDIKPIHPQQKHPVNS